MLSPDLEMTFLGFDALCSYLISLKEALTSSWVPVQIVRGTTAQPEQLQEALAEKDFPDLHDILWVQSLMELYLKSRHLVEDPADLEMVRMAGIYD